MRLLKRNCCAPMISSFDPEGWLCGSLSYWCHCSWCWLSSCSHCCCCCAYSWSLWFDESWFHLEWERWSTVVLLPIHYYKSVNYLQQIVRLFGSLRMLEDIKYRKRLLSTYYYHNEVRKYFKVVDPFVLNYLIKTIFWWVNKLFRFCI